jgi:tetratricopeptide (TPR) repeat protein
MMRIAHAARTTTVVVLAVAVVAAALLAWRSARPAWTPPTLPPLDMSTMEAPVRAALESAEANVQRTPGDTAAWLKLAFTYDAHHLEDAALACYSAIGDAGGFQCLYNHAIVLGSVGRTAEAESRMNYAISLRPQYPAAHYRVAELRVQLGRSDDAHQSYEQALRLDASMAMAQRGLGQLLLSMGQPKEALTHLDAAVQAMPDDHKSWVALAQAHMRLGQQSHASAAAEQAKGLQESASAGLIDPVRHEVLTHGVSASLCVDRAKQMMLRGEYGPAIEQLKVVEAAHPDDSKTQLWLGTCHEGLNRSAEAEACYRQALTFQPDMFAAHFQLAAMLSAAGRRQEAATHYRAGLQHSPTDVSARVALATTLAALKQPDGALVEFQEAAHHGELDATARFNWGSVLARKGRFGDAVGHFMAATQLRPDYVEAYWALGRVLEGLNRPADAARVYRQLLAIAPHHAARERLSALTP